MKKHDISTRLKGSYYLKMLVLYSCTFLLAFIPMTFIMLYNQQKNQQENMERGYVNTLTQFQIYSDHYILDPVHAFVSKDIHSSQTFQEDILLSPETYRYNFNDFDDILYVLDYLSSFALNSDIIDSVYVYQPGYDTFVSTSGGCFYYVTSRQKDYASFVPYALLDYCLNQDSNQFWIPPSDADDRNSRNIVSLAQVLPAFTAPSDSELILFINLDLNRLYADYFSDFDTEASEMLILDNNGALLYSTKSDRAADDEALSALTGLVTAEAGGASAIRLDDADYQVNWITSVSKDWRYVYLTRSTNLLLSVIRSSGGILLFAVLLSCSCLIAVYLISNWLYRPIRQLINFSRNATGADAVGADDPDEFSLLGNRFHNLSARIDQLQRAVEENNSLLVSNTIKELVNGNVSSLKELNERLSMTGESFPYPYFYLLCINIDSATYASLDYQKRTYMQIDIINLLNDFSFDSERTRTKALSVFHHSGSFTTVINTDAEDPHLQETLEKLLDVLTDEYSDCFNLAVSPLLRDIDEFEPARKTLMEYFKYQYIYGNHNIFTREKMAENEPGASFRPQASLKLLTSLIHKHDAPAVKQEIAVLFQQSRDGKTSLLYTYNLSLEIINLICHECEALGIRDESLSHAFLVDSLRKQPTLESTIAWFDQVVDRFMACQQAKSSSLDATVIPSILAYMQTHVDSQLSLNSIADHFNLSTGHLSRLFKEKTGTNFQDHLIRLKLNTAARMLVEEPSRKVTDIAESLGYANISYFNKMFKEMFGVTPTQYRKMNFTP